MKIVIECLIFIMNYISHKEWNRKEHDELVSKLNKLLEEFHK